MPEFLQKGWCRQDGRVAVCSRKAVYSRKAGRVVIDWRTPEHTGFEGNLYSISALPEDREWVEREVMAKRVDGPAAPILKRLLAGDLNADNRTVWGRFMMAQWCRSPTGSDQRPQMTGIARSRVATRQPKTPNTRASFRLQMHRPALYFVLMPSPFESSRIHMRACVPL